MPSWRTTYDELHTQGELCVDKARFTRVGDQPLKTREWFDAAGSAFGAMQELVAAERAKCELERQEDEVLSDS
jgi:hypothetical protein